MKRRRKLKLPGPGSLPLEDRKEGGVTEMKPAGTQSILRSENAFSAITHLSGMGPGSRET